LDLEFLNLIKIKKEKSMQIKKFTANYLKTNNFLVWDEATHKAFLVDVSEGFEDIQSFIEKEELILEALLLTHAHFDHIMKIDDFLGVYPEIPVYQHESEKDFLFDPTLNLSAYARRSVGTQKKVVQKLLKEGDVLDFAGGTWKVLHVPGHSPGGVIFLEEEKKMGFSGDLIFEGGIVGRSDIRHANAEDFKRSLERILSFESDYTFHTGHGGDVSLAKEKELHTSS
jgi:glyoxylase-like metal-dependent hydrolase (beta-lactamase superfamily II)